jgi:hypothetical protein
MKLSEDVPLDVCVKIDKLSSQDPGKCQKSIIKDGLIPRKWNVVILNSSYIKEKNAKFAGIYTALNILEQAFPNENPLTAPICDEKHRNVYILYSDYLEEIKTVLPVACGINFISFSRYQISRKLNLFLHYINANDITLEQFRSIIRRLVDDDKYFLIFYTLCQYDQKILCLNTREKKKKNDTKESSGDPGDDDTVKNLLEKYPWYFENVVKPYWLHILRNIRKNFSMDQNFNDKHYDDMKSHKKKLKNGEELTYNMCLYFNHKIHTADKNSKFIWCKKQYKKFTNYIIFLTEALEKVISEYHGQTWKGNFEYLTTDYVFFNLLMIRSYNHEWFDYIIELLEKY